MLLQASVTCDPKVVLALAIPLVLFWILYTFLWSSNLSSYPLPPGPPGKFLFGNAGQLSEHPEQDYIRWGKEYSEYFPGRETREKPSKVHRIQFKAIDN